VDSDTPDELLVPATPTTYTLEVTSRCNSACVGCGNVFQRTLGDMDVEQLRHLLANLKPHVINLRLTGGEPTLHSQFPALICLIDGLGAPFVLFSNGLWPDPDETLALLLDCVHLDGVLISLHGHNAAMHQAFAGVNSFDQVTTTIRQATRAGLTINTNTVLTRYNHQDIAAIATVSRNLGARFAAFSRYYGPPTPVTDLTESELHAATATVLTLQRQGVRVHFNNCVPVCFDGQPTKSCPAGITHCTIDPLGRVRPCTHAPHILGDLSNQSIADIWQGEAANQWRALLPPICKTCAEFVRCRGGCKALAYHLHQDRDPLIRGPLQQLLSASHTTQIQLYSGARPEPNFTLREEAFGYLLVNRNQIIPVKTEARPLLDALDGTTTLRQVQDDFGPSGLALVVYLFNKGLVRLAQS
jgi:radical SAM protein with 4Fe4S-binding SPASM domain